MNNLKLKIYILFSNKTIKWILIPTILFIFWILASFTIGSYKSFAVLRYAHNYNDVNSIKNLTLLKDKSIIQGFKAAENHLGIVEVKIGKVKLGDLRNEDVILFKIREEGQNGWLFINEYKTGSFASDEFFPFGFPEIVNSKGKKYEFEIYSQNGNEINYIVLQNASSDYQSKYKIPKNEIMKSPKSFLTFINKKIRTFFNNYDTLYSSLGFLVPLLFYFIWSLLRLKKVNLKNNTFFYLALFFIGLSILSIYFKLIISVDILTFLVYFLLVMGLLQMVIEKKRK